MFFLFVTFYIQKEKNRWIKNIGPQTQKVNQVTKLTPEGLKIWTSCWTSLIFWTRE